jgi:hypothetical protein
MGIVQEWGPVDTEINIQFHKGYGVPWIAKRLLTSKGGLYSVELIG